MITRIFIRRLKSIKKRFGNDAVAIFVMPPDIATLEHRLRSRGTDSAETIERRLAKAEFEMGFAPQFDTVVVNDSLPRAVAEVADKIRAFATCGIEAVCRR